MTQWGIDTLFNPAKRHMDDEKRRLQSTREEVGDNSGGKRVDLESGKVVIKRADVSDDDDLTDDETHVTGKHEKDAAKTKSARPTPSAAAVRAAQRRGRTPR